MTRPFGSQFGIGQPSGAATNPFSQKPFGSNLSGSSATGVFGQPSTQMFGASSSPAFGSSSAFGASSSPAFVTSSNSFGRSTQIGRNINLGGFGSSTPSQTSLFVIGAFGSATTFGASTQPTFGSTPAPSATTFSPFGASTASNFGNTTVPTFGSTAYGVSSSPAFGSTTFGVSSTAAFGSAHNAFGVSSTPAFGSTQNAFGSSSSSPFGATSTNSFGSSTSFGSSSSTPTFIFGSTTPFGTTTTSSSIPSFSFGSTPPFGTTTTSLPFGTQSPSSGTPVFGQSTLGGSRVAKHTPTKFTEETNCKSASCKMHSIAAMDVYKDKNHEELRWEDYQRGDKGGFQQTMSSFSLSNSQATGTGGISFTSPAPSFLQTNNAFHSSPSQQKPNAFSFGTRTQPASQPTQTSSGFSFFNNTRTQPAAPAQTSSPFSFASQPANHAQTSSAFSFDNSQNQPATHVQSPNTSPFSNFTQPASQPAPLTSSLFNNSRTQPASQPTSSAFSFCNNNQAQPANPAQSPSNSPFANFNRTQPAVATAPSAWKPDVSFIGTCNQIQPATPTPAQTSSAFSFDKLTQTQPAFSAQISSIFSVPAQTSSAFSFSNPNAAQPGSSTGLGFTSSISGPGSGSMGQLSYSNPTMVMQPVPPSNHFGTIPAPLQISTAPSVRHGISSMRVVEKPAPIRMSNLSVPRHLSQRRMNLPLRKYNPKTDGPKLPFFMVDEEKKTSQKADQIFIPRENPRSLIISPIEQRPSRASTEPKEKDKTHNSTYIDGQATTVDEHNIDSLLPNLPISEYYTEPQKQELAAKERVHPGFCRHVKNFIVGRHGYGCIRFEDETDITGLDIESIIEFNNREVIVYKDESKKPPMGMGLNKPAEITLLNVKCVNKKTGTCYTEGVKVEKYEEMLRKKTEEQGAEFVCFDAVKGVWKFRVKHF